MRDSRPKLLDNLFNNTSLLRNVQQRAVALLQLNNAVKALLPVPLKPWCRVANYRQGILVLETANASRLMRLRYEQPNLLTALRADILPSLVSIDIRINPALVNNIPDNLMKSEQNITISNEERTASRQLSQQSAHQLHLLAKRSPKGLKEKLERLASLAGESTSETKSDK